MNSCLIIDRMLGPPVCQLCGDAGLGPEICRGCYRDLPRARHPCAVCARPLGTAGACSDCVSRAPLFDRATAPFVYGFPIDRMLRRLKYRGTLPHGRLLGELLGHAVRRLDEPPSAVIPVPLHRRRLQRRGFNQAREIAAAVSRVVSVPILDRLCEREVDTPPLWSLNPTERTSCLAGAFRCRGRAPRRVAIVDDVLTTGSTVTALTRALKQAGAERVLVWAVARSPGVHVPASAPPAGQPGRAPAQPATSE